VPPEDLEVLPTSVEGVDGRLLLLLPEKSILNYIFCLFAIFFLLI
jgi:hypothetical protein